VRLPGRAGISGKHVTMPNSFFQFKQFTVQHDRCAMKVTTDGCLFGAWVAKEVHRFTGLQVHLLDIGAGTGLLSLMVAQKNSAAIDAVEIDPAAALQAQENVSASPWKETIFIIRQDVLQWKTTRQYDCIFSNPPFYENELRSGNGIKNIAHHDEGLKLSGLFQFIKRHLKSEGRFFLLLPAKRETEAEALLQSHGLHLQRKVLVQQTLKHQPFRMMIQGRRQKVERVTEERVSIRDEKDTYTPEFVSLLKDYYLYL
jgi:tRNA1Val (adenine37-N6)-methyltransferase